MCMDTAKDQNQSKLVLKAEIINNKMAITLGTKHEALLCLALRKCELYITEVLLENEFKEEPVSSILKPGSEIQIPKSLVGKL